MASTMLAQVSLHNLIQILTSQINAFSLYPGTLELLVLPDRIRMKPLAFRNRKNILQCPDALAGSIDIVRFLKNYSLFIFYLCLEIRSKVVIELHVYVTEIIFFLLVFAESLKLHQSLFY